MEFLLPGPLVIRSGGSELRVPAARQRVILAALVLNANRVVPVDTIAGFVWDGAPPPSAAATIRTYVMRLRQVLGKAGGSRTTTRAPGYLIELEEDETDLGRFTAHRKTADALVQAGRTAEAVEELHKALALWRHDPLMDVPSRILHDAEASHLQRLHLQTRIWRVDLDLELQRHAEILPELWQMVREHPLHEGLIGRLMPALFRSGQQPEALDLFQRTRAAPIDQLGTEPGFELRAVQRRILRAEDEPPRRRDDSEERQEGHGGPGRSWQGWPIPAQLPQGVTDFTARTPETVELGRLLRDKAPAAGPATTVVITGAGGIGKTAPALHAAHSVRADFADGQVFADLEGSTGHPARPAEVLTRVLVGLGVPDVAVPKTMADRICLFRSLVADRRMLIVLDDAVNVAQVRPLIPGSGESRVIVTSRHRLADLEGAHDVTLDALDEDSSLELLERFTGRPRIDAERVAARRLVETCAGVPLALRIVGCRLRSRPRRSLGALAHRLFEQRRLLDELHVGDLSVRPGLDAGYATLRDRSVHGIDLAAAFRRLGVGNMPYVRGETAAVLLNCSEEHAEDVLDVLVDAHLLREHDHSRYHLDALVRAYARERADAEECLDFRVETLRCLLRWYLHILDRSARPCGPGDPERTYVLRQSAVDWTDDDREGLFEALAEAERTGVELIGRQLVGEVRAHLPPVTVSRAASG
ncbi:AfsR/SARP family transcriptional regulator [Streptomyces ipomoeae]|nr:AfsR/SARP family transcriptional regulator [Streptomyces ipomoeae]MDX2934779.1 BTAD domain-containing putative transcriptional regulator [Streptomyces ipomoeae]TQE21042.1 AfsR/SARP family transcriptional regulator [Streptomyces ipomoeae]